MIVPVTPGEAVKFVREHHYSGTAFPGAARYGWADSDGTLIGVSIYDNGTHAMRQGVFGPEHYRRVMHHHRLALLPGAPKCTASQFMAAAMRDLQKYCGDKDCTGGKDCPGIWAIVTYADACQDHVGTIYQATNAIYTGVKAKGNLKFLDQDGGIHTTQTLAGIGDWPARRVEAAARGWTEIRCKGKYRYVHMLGTKRQQAHRPPLLWPVLPYPHRPAEVLGSAA